MKKFRIVSWNIRAGGGKRIEGIYNQLLRWDPTVVGLCEFRGTPASTWLRNRLYDAGLSYQISCTDKDNPAKNALLLTSRHPLRRMNVRDKPSLKERWVLARTQTAPGIAIGLMHAPNFSSPELKYPFLEVVNQIAAKWRSGPGILLGDTNCTRQELDEEKALQGNFQKENDFIENLEARGWTDSFRKIHGIKREYTWYSHRNNGFRLDQAFCNRKLLPALNGFRHEWGCDPNNPSRRNAFSDHAAMILDFDFRKE